MQSYAANPRSQTPNLVSDACFEGISMRSSLPRRAFASRRASAAATWQNRRGVTVVELLIAAFQVVSIAAMIAAIERLEWSRWWIAVAFLVGIFVSPLVLFLLLLPFQLVAERFAAHHR